MAFHFTLSVSQQFHSTTAFSRSLSRAQVERVADLNHLGVPMALFKLSAVFRCHADTTLAGAKECHCIHSTKATKLTRKRSCGFTLVELLVVIAIIGILMGFAACGASGKRSGTPHAMLRQHQANCTRCAQLSRHPQVDASPHAPCCA